MIFLMAVIPSKKEAFIPITKYNLTNRFILEGSILRRDPADQVLDSLLQRFHLS